MKVRNTKIRVIAVFVPPDVDVEVTVLRFCSNFIGFGMDEIKTLYKKKGRCLSKSPNPIHILS